MRNADIDDMLDEAAHAPHAVPSGLLDRIVGSVGPGLQPVRPLLPTALLTGGLVLIATAIALLGALRAGFQGVEALSAPQRLLIFGALTLLGALLAVRTVSEWIPGSARPPKATAMLAAASVVVLGLFALLFHDYSATHFVPRGITCLATGVMHAVIAAPLLWWLLHRGYAVNPVSAGLAAGTLAGLAGLGMLELHCVNFEAPHVLLWHTLVVPVSAALGAIVALAATRSAR